MLEPQIAADTARAILSSAEQVHASRVVSAQLVIGSMRVVDEEELRQHLASMLRGSVAEGAKIEIERPPATMRCLDCGEVYEIHLDKPASYDCPSCKSGHHAIESGMELELGEVQGIVPSQETQSMVDRMAKAVENAFGPVDAAK